MASNEQSATLLRKNKRAQVEALNSLGFNLTEGARAADFPMYVKWGAGLLDLNVAANRVRDDKKFFFTVDEWHSLSATEQQQFLLRGIRVRACGTSFIIAPDTLTNKAWGPRDKNLDLHNFQTQRDLYFFYDAYEETRIIVETLAGLSGSGVDGAPAAEAAMAYKAYNLLRDGLEDTSEWCMPLPAHLMIMFRWVNEINAAFASVWSADFGIMMIPHWSCGRWTNNEIFRLRFNEGGAVYVDAPTLALAVRPICLS